MPFSNRIFAVLPAMLLLFTAAYGADYFVSTRGNDDSPGSLDQPFRTIQRAADAAGPGDTCFVREGTYRESVTIERGGREGAPLQFTAFPGEVVVLDGTEPLTGS